MNKKRDTQVKNSRAETLCGFAASVAIILLIVGILLLSVQAVLFNKSFYNWQFEKNNSYKELELSKEQLHLVRDKLIDYFSYESNELQVYVAFDGEDGKEPFYTEKELSHMDDAREVYKVFSVSSNIFVIIGAGAFFFIYFLVSKKYKTISFWKIYSHGAFMGGKAFLISGMVLFLCMLLFFSKMFNIFHKILFPQGNWSFPSYSNMMTIFPNTFFIDSALIILSAGFVAAVFFLVSGIVIKDKCNIK